MKDSKSKVVRGRFRLGENAFPTAKEKRETVEREMDAIFKNYEKKNKEEKRRL